MHSFRFEAAFDCPADHLMAVAREFDLMSSWNRLSLDSAILAEPSIFTSVRSWNLRDLHSAKALPGSALPDAGPDKLFTYMLAMLFCGASKPHSTYYEANLKLDFKFQTVHALQVVYAAQWLPFPMHHSDLVIHAHWADLAEVRDCWARGFEVCNKLHPPESCCGALRRLRI